MDQDRLCLRILLLTKLSQPILPALVQVVLLLVLSLTQEARGHPGHKPTDCSRAYGHPLHESNVHGGANVHPLHKLMVCSELTL